MSGLILFVGIYLLSDYASSSLSLPIPGAIIGLVLMLVVLMVRGRVDAPIKEAADAFLRYLPLMLVPVGVGVVKLLSPAPEGIWKLELVLVIALIIGAAVTAKIFQGIIRLRDSRTSRARVPASEPSILAE
jgi:holin-like protein